MPYFPVLHYLPEFAQIHVHWVRDAIQPLILPSSLALNLSIRVFQGVGTLHQVAKVLELQHQSFQWIFRVDFLKDWLVWFPCCPRDSQESSKASNSKFWKHQFFSIQPSLWPKSHICIWLLEKPQPWQYGPLPTYPVWVCHSFSSEEQEPFNFRPAVTVQSFGAQENVRYSFHFFPIYLPWNDGTGCYDLSCLNVEFEASFYSFTSIKRFSVSSLSAIKVVSSAYQRLLFL